MSDLHDFECGLPDDFREAIKHERAIERALQRLLGTTIALSLQLHPNAYAYEYLIGLLWIQKEAFEESNPLPGPVRILKKKRIGNRLRTQVYERDKYRCVKCGSWKDLSLDHIVPESKGGPAELDNLQTLCRACNSSKGAN